MGKHVMLISHGYEQAIYKCDVKYIYVYIMLFH